MRINTLEEYSRIPDGTILQVFQSGTSWNSDFGKTNKVVKIKNKLYNIGDFFEFSEKDDKNYEIEIAWNEKSEL